MRRRLLRARPLVSFFAFQDVITAVTGIILLVALLMALQIARPGESSTAAGADRLRLRDALQQEATALAARVAAEGAGQAAGDPEASGASANNLQQLAEHLEAENARLAAESGGMTARAGEGLDLEGLERRNEAAAAQLRNVQESTRQLVAQVEEARRILEQGEASVLEELRNSEDLWLIPERSKTAKEPVLIAVYEDRFTLQPVDARQPREHRRKGGAAGNLEAALRDFDPAKQFLVFYFRPSTLDDFETITAQARKQRFEIGYDLVEEDSQVRFAVAPEVELPAPPSQPPASEGPADGSPASGGGSPAPGGGSPALGGGSPASGGGSPTSGGGSPAPDAAEPVDIAKEMDSRGKPSGSGSGFFITPQGHLVTNHHVVVGAGTIFVGNKEAGWRRAVLMAGDEKLDLAVLRVTGEAFPALPVARSEEVRLGQSVAAIGFPNVQLLGVSPKLTKGEVSSLAGIQDDPTFFQISVGVQPGNSGGPLFDSLGNVVGVVSGKINQDLVFAMTGTLAENINYAIKSSVLLDWLSQSRLPDLALPQVQKEVPAKFEDAVAAAERAAVMILVFP